MPTASHCVVSSLLSALARSGCSKSIIRPQRVDESTGCFGLLDDKLLYVWILNPGIKFSSSNSDRVFAAIKVVYGLFDTAEADKVVDSPASDVQELRVPTEVIQQITELLRRTNLILPPGQRTFKGLDVSILERWS